ncbi:MAG: ubiquinone/menaquinone biosynthesis methyltransferase [Acidobacteria bacterium]|nr:ubiquinone/menaquinone biosynthesis methyltransferase [Acidobacteriota bacterium]
MTAVRGGAGERPAGREAGAAAGVDKGPARIAAMFDAIARRYDLLNRVLSAGLDQRWRARAVRSLGLTGRETVVDFCTGTADLAIALAGGRGGAARVVGLDFAGEMLRHGRAKLRRSGLERRVALVRADATQAPLADGAVDAATVAFGIRNVEQPQLALSEMHRLVRPGGRIAILEFGMPRLPVVGAAYGWYFRRVLPRLGSAVSGHGSAYAYLPASVGAFPGPEAFCRLLGEAGFRDARAVPLQMGIVYLYEAARA